MVIHNLIISLPQWVVSCCIIQPFAIQKIEATNCIEICVARLGHCTQRATPQRGVF